MCRKKNRNAFILIYDVGKSVAEKTPGNNSFFERSRNCISWIIRRKITSNSNDLICLLLTGVDKSVSTEDEMSRKLCKNVYDKYNFGYASLDLLEYIETEVTPGNNISDWVGTLAYATEKLRSIGLSHDNINKIVVIFSDLSYTFPAAVGEALTNIKNLDIEVNFIGTDLLASKSVSVATASSSSHMEVDTDDVFTNKSQYEMLEKEIFEIQKRETENGGKLVYIMSKMLGDNIRTCTFESASKQLSHYLSKVVNPRPWNCVLDIGDVKIKLQLFKKNNTKSNSVVSKLKAYNSIENSYVETKRDKIMHYKHINATTGEVKNVSVENDDVISGYRYGTSIIPFSDADKSLMGFKPGAKCFSVLGFTHIENIPFYVLTGEGAYAVLPRADDEFTDAALSSLIQALLETESVAIVRRVYSEDKGLSLGVLYPAAEKSEDEDEFNCRECLTYIELAFADDIKTVRLPGLKTIKKKITREQYDVIDELINDMDLMKVESGSKSEFCEELDLSSRHGLKNQFFLHCLFHKAMYPNKPLPDRLPESYHRYVMPPEKLYLKSQKLTKKLLKLFPKKTEDEEAVPCAEKERNTNFYNFATEKEQTAENCFKKLFNARKYPYSEAIQNLINLSVNTFNFKQTDVIKAFIQVTKATRQKALTDFPDDYNYWLRRLRISLGNVGKLECDYWKEVLNEKLGLITNDESSRSQTKKEDAIDFIESLTPKTEETVARKKRKIQLEEEEAIDKLF